MRSFLLGGCLILIALGRPISAAEPILEFLDGLKRRGYDDLAVEYLNQIESRSDVPDEIRRRVPYERAHLLLESASRTLSPELQRKNLDAAQTGFEDFLKRQPQHVLAPSASAKLVEILLAKSRLQIWESEQLAPGAERNQALLAVRGRIQEGRRLLEQAKLRQEQTLKGFPAHIPETQKQQLAARTQAEGEHMKSQLDLAECSYWEAQTYEPGSPERRERLTSAAKEYEQVHQQYRRMLGGLLARIWQGKCYEEQGEVNRALGIYAEFLDQDAQSAEVQSLKDRARWFRLICLNHPERKEHQIAAREAEEWIVQSKDRLQSDVGLGIQWESCRAYEALGQSGTLSEALKRNSLTVALDRSRQISRLSDELRAPAMAMVHRLSTTLNRNSGEPKNFEDAYNRATVIFNELSSQPSTPSGEVTASQAQATMLAKAAEMSRLYDLALRFPISTDDVNQAGLARLRLAYGYLLQRRVLEAAAIADFQMRKHADGSPDTAQEAGFLALAAFDQAYRDAESGERAFEEQMIRKMADELVRRWPDSERAQDARDAVAKLAWQNGNLVEAANWWEQVSPESKLGAAAKIRAGKAYWRRYVLDMAKPAAERAPAEQLVAWKDLAADRFEEGLAAAEQQFAPPALLPDEFVAAKLQLVGIRNLDGRYQSSEQGPGALELLTEEPHAVLDAVDVEEGEARPADPGRAQSRQMASLAYQQLLRTQIGLRNLDAAREAREKLEQVAGSEDAAALTQVFVDFGREIERELERLQSAGNTERLNEVRQGFNSFLNDLAQRQDGQTFHSLLWIAETFASLGEGSSDAEAEAREFLKKATATYRDILKKAEDTEFASKAQRLACQLRLVNCLRQQQEFVEAEQELTALLKETPQAPDVQFEAARLYQDWAAESGADARPRYEVSLYGSRAPAHVWGWNYTAQTLQRAVQQRSDERLEQMHYDARYAMADAERLFGNSFDDPALKKEHLERARSAIVGFHRVSRRWPDEEYSRFNSLYRTIQADLGGEVSDLPRELAEVRTEVATSDPSTPEAVPETPVESSSELQAGPAGLSTMELLLFAALMLGGVAAAAWMVLAPKKKKKPVRVSSGAEPVRTGAAPIRKRRLPETLPELELPGGNAPEKSPPRPSSTPAGPGMAPTRPPRPPRSST